MNFSLYLYAQGEVTQDRSRGLEKFLADIGLISTAAPASFGYPSGAQTMQLITFVGCSPALEAGNENCEVRLHLFPVATWMGGDSVETVRFPGCKHPLPNPVELFDQTRHGYVQCTQCGQQGLIEEVNWRRSAGCSKCFIEITSIFPKEALPADPLLNQLKTYSAAPWDWFYSRTSRS